MKFLVSMILVIIGITILISVIWRLKSRRQSLPCPVYLRWLVELDNPFTKTNRAATIIRHLGIEPGMSVLDIGCGPGRLAVPVAKKVGDQGRVVALDIQSGMLKRAQAKAEAANLTNILFINAGVGEGKMGKNQFDRALLVTVLGEIPDQKMALREIFDALKPGGILSVTELIFDPHFQRRRKVSELSGKAGFKEEAFYGNRIAYTLHFKKPKNF